MKAVPKRANAASLRKAVFKASTLWIVGILCSTLLAPLFYHVGVASFQEDCNASENLAFEILEDAAIAAVKDFKSEVSEPATEVDSRSSTTAGTESSNEEETLLAKSMWDPDVLLGLRLMGLTRSGTPKEITLPKEMPLPKEMTPPLARALRVLGVNAYQGGNPISWSVVTEAESDVLSARVALLRQKSHSASAYQRREMAGGSAISKEDLQRFQRQGFLGPLLLPLDARVADRLLGLKDKWQSMRSDLAARAAISDIQPPSEWSCFLWMEECYSLGMHPAIVQAVQTTTGQTDLVLHKVVLMEVPAGGMEAFHIDIEASECTEDAVVLIGLSMLLAISSPPVDTTKSLQVMAQVLAAQGKAVFQGERITRAFLEKVLIAELRKAEPRASATISSVLNGADDMVIFRSATWHAVINPMNETRQAVAIRYTSPACPIQGIHAFAPLIPHSILPLEANVTPSIMPLQPVPAVRPTVLSIRGRGTTTTITGGGGGGGGPGDASLFLHPQRNEDSDIRRWAAFQKEENKSHLKHQRLLRDWARWPVNDTWGDELLKTAKRRSAPSLIRVEKEEAKASWSVFSSSCGDGVLLRNFSVLGSSDIVAATALTAITSAGTRRRNKVLSPLHFHEEGELIFVVSGMVTVLKLSQVDPQRMREKAVLEPGSVAFFPSNTMHMIAAKSENSSIVSIRWRPKGGGGGPSEGGAAITGNNKPLPCNHSHCPPSQRQQGQQRQRRGRPPSMYHDKKVGPILPLFHQPSVKGLGGVAAYIYTMAQEKGFDPGTFQGYDAVVVPLSGESRLFPYGSLIKEQTAGFVPAFSPCALWNVGDEDATVLIVEIHSPVIFEDDKRESEADAALLGMQQQHLR